MKDLTQLPLMPILEMKLVTARHIDFKTMRMEIVR